MDDSSQPKILTYFADYPNQLDLFKVVRQILESFGPVIVDVMKTQISFGTNYKFAWVWLPQKWGIKQTEDSMVLSFGLDRLIKDPRIKEVISPYPGRWIHHLVINRAELLDSNVSGWLGEAYQFSKRPRKKGQNASK